jgi:5-methylcytosine-specific restriction endonuclease McrA
MRRDPVTPELRDAVLQRDDYRCVARRACDCLALGDCDGRLTLDHVKDQPRMGKRAPSDMAHLVTLCWHHHLGSGWATAHRPELRAYLQRVAA